VLGAFSAEHGGIAAALAQRAAQGSLAGEAADTCADGPGRTHPCPLERWRAH
jgi:hypothetical protein